jgi:FkbM family methyltransferase
LGRTHRKHLYQFKYKGFKWYTHSIKELWWLYPEIFILEPYFFESDKSSPFIIDLGANLGFAILYFKSVYPNCAILAFEPVTDSFRLTEKNINENNIMSVELVNSGVAAKDGSGYINCCEDSKAATFTGRLNDGIGTPPVTWIESCSLRKLSPYIQSCVDFLKMDIEGAEYSILSELESAGKLPYVKRLFIEYHYTPGDWSQNSLSAILEILKRNGFSFYIKEQLFGKLIRNDFPLRYCGRKFSLNIYARQDYELETAASVRRGFGFLEVRLEKVEKLIRKKQFERAWHLLQNTAVCRLTALFESYGSISAKGNETGRKSSKLVPFLIGSRLIRFRQLKRIAILHQRVGKFEIAYAYLIRLWHYDRRRYDVLRALLNSAVYLGRRADAEALVSQLSHERPASFDEFQEALCWEVLGRKVTTLELLESVIKKIQTRDDIREKLIQICWQLRRYERALELLRQKSPQDGLKRIQNSVKIIDILSRLNRMSEAEKEYLELSNTSDRQLDFVHRTRCLICLKRYEEAFVLFQKSISNDRKNASHEFILIQLLYKTGQHAEARERLNELDSELTDSIREYRVEFSSLYNLTGQYSETIELVRDVKPFERDFLNTRFLYADALAQLGRNSVLTGDLTAATRYFEEAIEKLEEMTTISPERLDVLISMSDIYGYLNKNKQAAKILNFVEMLAPDETIITRKT